MSLTDRLSRGDFTRVTPGTLSTERQRLRLWMELHRAGRTVSPWMRLALLGQLRPAIVGGVRS